MRAEPPERVSLSAISPKSQGEQDSPDDHDLHTTPATSEKSPTIGRAKGPVLNDAPCLLPTTDEVISLTRQQQDEYLTLLTKGASAAAACQKLGISITALLVTMEQSPKFRTRATSVSDVLSQNVAAQLYQTAMKGSVTAQTFYLRNQPPPEWPEDEHASSASPEKSDSNEISDERLASFVVAARKKKATKANRSD